MAFDADQEILQDFLAEAGELLEALGPQLVELEQRPGDAELLNAAFRAFHTIKGGAGFVGLDPLVRLCHVAEDAFNLLRSRERTLDGHVMDLLLQTLDVVSAQFDDARDGRTPAAAPAPLLTALHDWVVAGPQDGPAAAPDESASPVIPAPVPAPAAAAPAAGATAEPSDPADLALEALFDEVSARSAPGQPAGAESADADASADAADAIAEVLGGGSDEIGDDEFEALLDALHGSGRAPGPAGDPAPDPAPQSVAASATAPLSADGIVAVGAPSSASASASVPAATSGSVPVSNPDASSARTPAQTPAQTPAHPSGPARTDPAEDVLAAAPGAGASSSAAPVDDTVRVDVRRLDEIMNLVGELVLARNRLNSYQQTLRDTHLARIASNVDRVTADMQAAVMASRLQPVKRVFARFPRLVRDLARDLGKAVRLDMQGVDTELDKNLVDALGEPLVHLVRNAVDHGVELPEVRVAAGKPREATVTLAARHGGDHVLVTVAEDGAGMDPERIRQRAVERGLISADESGRMKDTEAWQLIFEPGFSTREAVSDVSGRGVGMDVVKTRIAQLNGSVDIESTAGAGSCFSIRLPLTLAIMPTLMVRIGGQRFALPLSNVIETYGLTPGRLQVVGEQPVMMIRGEILPLHHARALLGQPPADVPEHVVAMLVDNRRIGLVVDDLIGKEEVVIKPLGTFVRSLPGLAGATITGDGRIALILDAADLIRRAAPTRRAEGVSCPTI